MTHNAPPIKLLIIDDDDVDRERVRRMLVQSCLEVATTEAASGDEALVLLASQAFDCIVLDNQLGDTTGATMLRQLQQSSASHCPIVMVTGAGNEALAVQALQDGASDYLSKLHLSPDNLAQAIMRGMERQQLRQQLDDMHQQLAQRVDDQAAVIRQRERELQDILDHTSSLIAYCDAGQCVRFGNRAHQAWFGKSPEQLPGLHLREVMGEKLYALHLPYIVKTLDGQAQCFEHAFATPHDALTRFVQVDYRPDTDATGTVTGFYITITDVSPIKAAQAHVEELLRFVEAVIEKAPVGMAVYKLDGSCVLVNSAMASLLSVDLSVIHHQTINLLARNHGAELAEAVQTTLTDGQTRYVNLTMQDEAMARRHVAWALARIERGTEPFLVAIARDITDQESLHESLVNARNAAEAAARIKSAFLANMSHEIRTPMNAIIGLSRLVLDEALPGSAREHIDRVHESALALMGILDDILDYSKVESGQMRLEHAPVHVEETLQRVSDLFAGRMAQKRIDFTIDLAHDVPTRVMGDPLRLSQLLNNLVGNAVKFTDGGAVHLAVYVAPAANAGTSAMLHFSVRDTGIGMDARTQQALFVPFAQGDVSITRQFGGSGLGLAICKKLVTMMDGQIGLSSAPGQGSAFWFTIPLQLLEESPARAPLDKTCWRVLLIGPQPDALQALTASLQAANTTTVTTSSAESAIDLIAQAIRQQAPFDAVLINWHEPGTATVTHLQGLRDQLHQRGLSNVPILCLLPPYARQALLDAGHAAQPDAVLIKPVLPGQIRKVLSKVHPRTETSVQASPAQALQQRGLPLKDKHVLLVEDNQLNQMVAQAFLQQAGMDVTCAADGAKALDVLSATPPNHFAAILMDMHMPVMDGLEASRRIRKLEGFRDIPIIAMTAAVLPDDKAQCVDAGMVDFVAKPIMAEHLIDVLLKWVPPFNAKVR